MDWRDVLNAGIVNQDIEPAVLRHDVLDHSCDCIRPGHIGRRIACRQAEIAGEGGADLCHLGSRS
ncbi:MAG: hypothetical protein QOD25_765 [Alphaproteobacteria bacterium]|jgi:hypothetical protein|nr:hypothetical protein [Alphaproteobacteria bacterium]